MAALKIIEVGCGYQHGRPIEIRTEDKILREIPFVLICARYPEIGDSVVLANDGGWLDDPVAITPAAEPQPEECSGSDSPR